jgi:integrase/recombinase XerC
VVPAPKHVHLGRRSGYIAIYGKRNKYREAPLNSTAREAMTNYLQTLYDGVTYVFPSRKGARNAVNLIGERALICIIGKYAERPARHRRLPA